MTNDDVHSLTARLALEWIAAERSAAARHEISVARDAAYDQRAADAVYIAARAMEQPPTTPEELAMASERVQLVLAGEVRWSEASPGDRAIWAGRFRDVEKYLRWQRRDENIDAPDEEDMRIPEVPPPPPPIPRTANVLGGTPAPDLSTNPNYRANFGGPRSGPRLHGYRERLWWNYYDTLTIDEHTRERTNMFGPVNIGMFHRSNMLVPNQLGSDSTFVVLGMWASISSMKAMSWFADHVRVQFIVGNKPATPYVFGRDLFMGIPFMPPYGRPIIVLVRQAFRVIAEIDPLPVPAGLVFDMTVHLDGVETRSIQ